MQCDLNVSWNIELFKANLEISFYSLSFAYEFFRFKEDKPIATGLTENVKTIKFLSVRWTDMSNILSVRPMFYRSGIKSPKLISNFLSVSRTDKFKNLSVRPSICRSRTDGPTVFIFSGLT